MKLVNYALYTSNPSYQRDDDPHKAQKDILGRTIRKKI